MIRIAAILLTVAYALAAVWVYLSQPAGLGSALAKMEAPLRWSPNEPAVWEQLGRAYLFDASQADPSRAKTAFLKAAHGSPTEPRVWTDLADAYQQAGDTEKAEAALRTALVVYPRSPTISWRLANSLILEGRISDALPLLKGVASSDPGLQRAVYDMGWKILDSDDAVLRGVVPDDLDRRAQYLNYMLVQRPKQVRAAVWQELRRGQHPETAALGYRLVETLLHTSREQEASAVWTDVLAFTGRSAARPAGTLMTNGDFEFDLPGQGLDWHVQKDPHWSATFDSLIFRNASRSLLLTFDGRSNPQFDGLSEWVVVRPGTSYRLRASIKTDNISSNSGMNLMVSSYMAPANENFTVLGPMHLGTEPWSEDTLAFRTGPHTTVIRVGLHRTASQKLASQLGGKVWLDDFRLELGNQQ